MTYEVAYRYGGNAGKLDNAGKQGNANNTGMQIVKSGNVWLVVWLAVMKAVAY